MPKYTIQLPDGRTMQAEAQSEAAAKEGAKKWYAANPKQAKQGAPKVPFYAEVDGQELNLNAPENAQTKARLDAEDKAAKKAESDRLANRSYARRGADAATFVLSAPVRMATQGQYGLGDITGLASEHLGNVQKESEANFAQANIPALQMAADFGTAASGVPGLNTMGAPLRGLRAVTRTVAASPRGAISGAIRGSGEALESASRSPGAIAGEGGIKLPAALNRAGQGMQSYANAMRPAQPKQTPINAKATQAGVPQNIQTIPERLRDMQAFRDLEMKPFGPALGSSGTARVGRTIEELPLVGGTVKSPKTDIELGLAKTQADIGRQLGSKGSEEAAGTMLQRGLERFHGAGIEDLEPSTLRGTPVGRKGPQRPLGIDPYQPIKASESLSGPAAVRAADKGIAAARLAGGGGVAETSKGAQTPAARTYNQIGLRRTNAEDLSDVELAKFIRAPSSQTSFASKAEALYESANRKIPALKRKDGAANPNEVPSVNLGKALDQTLREVGNQIAGQSTVTGSLARRILDGRRNFMFSDLRSIRTEIGRKLGSFGQFETGLDRTQNKRLYSAATQDMEVGLRDIANRAWRDHKAGPTLPDGTPNKAYIPASEARKADAALYEFRRADRYYRQGMERIDRFMDVLGAKTPNEAARKIATALKEKTANPQMLRQIKGVLRPEEVNALRGHVIENLGKGRSGAKMAESGFNVNHWATDFNDMMSHPAGREFMRGLPDGVSQKLENMARVGNRMKYYEATKNHSGSAYTAMSHPLAPAMASAGGAGLALFAPKLVASAALFFGGSGLIGKLLTSNAFLSWQEALMKAQLKAGNTAAGNAKILTQHIRRLPAIAKHVKDMDEQRAITALGLAIEQGMEGREKARALPAP